MKGKEGQQAEPEAREGGQRGKEDREGGGNEAHRGEEQLLVTRSGAKQALQQQHFVLQMRR